MPFRSLKNLQFAGLGGACFEQLHHKVPTPTIGKIYFYCRSLFWIVAFPK